MSNHESAATKSKEREFYQLNMQLEERIRSLMIDVDEIMTRQADAVCNECSGKSRGRNNNNNQLKPRKSHHQQQQSLMKNRENSFSRRRSNNSLPVYHHGCHRNHGYQQQQLQSRCPRATNGNSVSNVGKNGRVIHHKHVESIVSESDSSSVDDDDENDETLDGTISQSSTPKKQKKNKISTNEAIIRFLKAQVTKLQGDLRTAKHETNKKSDRVKDLELELKKQDDRREKFLQTISNQKEAIGKGENQNLELQTKIHSYIAEITSFKKEVEALKKEIKVLHQQATTHDLRLNRSLEENDKLKMSLKNAHTLEKELRDQVRKQEDDNAIFMKMVEKQKNELQHALKKQSELVEKLKQQLQFYEQSKEIQMLEEEFQKLANWKPDEKKT